MNQASLSDHWSTYKRVINAAEMDPTKYNATKEKISLLRKLLEPTDKKVLNGHIFRSTVSQSFDKNGVKIVENGAKIKSNKGMIDENGAKIDENQDKIESNKAMIESKGAKLEADIESTKAEVEAEIADNKAKVEEEIESTKAEVEAEIQSKGTKLEAMIDDNGVKIKSSKRSRDKRCWWRTTKSC